MEGRRTVRARTDKERTHEPQGASRAPPHTHRSSRAGRRSLARHPPPGPLAPNLRSEGTTSAPGHLMMFAHRQFGGAPHAPPFSAPSESPDRSSGAGRRRPRAQSREAAAFPATKSRRKRRRLAGRWRLVRASRGRRPSARGDVARSTCKRTHVSTRTVHRPLAVPDWPWEISVHHVAACRYGLQVVSLAC